MLEVLVDDQHKAFQIVVTNEISFSQAATVRVNFFSKSLITVWRSMLFN